MAGSANSTSVGAISPSPPFAISGEYAEENCLYEKAAAKQQSETEFALLGRLQIE
jgi:hypothetical protein